MSRLVITDKPDLLNEDPDGQFQVIKPHDYLDSEIYKNARGLKIINLCSSYRYQSMGYYVSLLAGARGHKVLPESAVIQGMRYPYMIRDETEDFDTQINKAFEGQTSDKIEFNIYFGFTENPAFNRIAVLLFNLFEVPILNAMFLKKKSWKLKSLRPVNFQELKQKQISELADALKVYLEGKKVVPKGYQRKKYDLAIMVNPEDQYPPSDEKALQRFVKAAETAGFNVEIITKNDYGKLIQFDALFIRETTNVNHYTYRFSKKAEAEGLVVVDDSNSILKCNNKVFLHELLTKNGILTPKTVILTKETAQTEIDEMTYPFILKQPDGSFSKGVTKIENKEHLESALKEFFLKSEIALIQEFMPTDYDWRVGIFDGKPIYVCKYYMARNHWQILDWRKTEMPTEGKTETLDILDAPPRLVEAALRATSLIGKGLYGVDIKEKDKKFYIIEINDNPNIDSGVEDKALKSNLYNQFMEVLLKKLKDKNQ